MKKYQVLPEGGILEFEKVFPQIAMHAVFLKWHEKKTINKMHVLAPRLLAACIGGHQYWTLYC
jgi:hypothetical protein